MRVERTAEGLRILDAEVDSGVYDLVLERGPDGGVFLVSMGENCTSLTRWDVGTGGLLWRVRDSFPPLNSLTTAVLPDGRVILAGGEFMDFLRWDSRHRRSAVDVRVRRQRLGRCLGSAVHGREPAGRRR